MENDEKKYREMRKKAIETITGDVIRKTKGI